MSQSFLKSLIILNIFNLCSSFNQIISKGANFNPMKMNLEHDILLKCARGEKVNRPPVWLMRQAGRYMSEFRNYSDKYPFRVRSETPEIAVELSLQPWKAFDVDGVIMFSDILTPFPAMGVEFDVVKGKGPHFLQPIRSSKDIENLKVLGEEVDIRSKLPFVAETLQTLKELTENKTTLIGFVGSPWTLGAYAMEGGSSKHCLFTKGMMMNDPSLFHGYMSKLAESVGEYACFQVENGAQVIQVFESWAHQLTPLDFETFARPYANMAMSKLKERHPYVPVIYFANGGSSYLESQTGMKCDMLSLDQFVDIEIARRRLGQNIPISGNIDPLVLLGPEEGIKNAVSNCVSKAGNKGHILNLGHGVLQETPERAVQILVQTAKNISYDSLE